MKQEKHDRNIFSFAFFAMLCLVLGGALIFTACGSSAGKTKGKKSDKSEETEMAETEKDSEESEKTDKESSSEDKEKSSSEKEKDEDKTTKKSETKSAKKDEAKKEKTPSADEIWADLMRGNKLFAQGKYSSGNLLSERPVLAKGQKPLVIVLSCSDSRVPPELVFGKNTGDLFVVRDAGNIVDEISLGSMEYAVEHLHAKVIVVLGHESCGAVAAAVSGEKMPTRNLQAIVDKISPGLKNSKDCPVGGKINLSCVEQNVNQTAKNIVEKSGLLEKAADEDEIAIIRAVYRMETGEVVRLD